MPNSNPVEAVHLDLARSALNANTAEDTIGDFVSADQVDEQTLVYVFESKLEAYKDWRWSVTLSVVDGDVTVSEVLLLPGEDSLLAPAWVPWSERLAEWKASQAELEAESETEAGDEETDESELEGEGESDWVDTGASFDREDLEHDLEHEEAAVLEEDSALTDSEESKDSEQNSDNAGKRPPRFGGRNRRRNQNKNK